MIIATPEYEVDLTNLASKIQEAGYQVTVVGASLHIDAPKESSAEINRLAFDTGITLSSISVDLPTLEETFFEMTGDNK